MKRYYSQNSMAVNNPKLTVKIFALKKSIGYTVFRISGFARI